MFRCCLISSFRCFFGWLQWHLNFPRSIPPWTGDCSELLPSAGQVDYQLVGAKKVGHWEIWGLYQVPSKFPRRFGIEIIQWLENNQPKIQIDVKQSINTTRKFSKEPKNCCVISSWIQILFSHVPSVDMGTSATFPRQRCNKPSQDLEQLKGEGMGGAL